MRIPVQHGGHESGGGQQHNAEVAGHEQQPAAGKNDADGEAVADFEEFRDSADTGTIEPGDEDECGEDHCGDAADPFEVGDSESMSVGSSAGSDDVGAADVSGHQRHADRPPRQLTSGEEEIRTTADTCANPEPEDHGAGEIGDDDDVVQNVQNAVRRLHDTESPGGWLTIALC